MSLIINLIINTGAVALAAYLVPGVSVDTWLTALIVSIVFGILNTILKPILVVLTLPITIITLGIFYLVLNVFIVYLVDYIVPGFTVTGFIPALLFSLALSLVSWFLNKLK
jgi:putative membrane protein